MKKVEVKYKNGSWTYTCAITNTGGKLFLNAYYAEGRSLEEAIDKNTTELFYDGSVDKKNSRWLFFRSFRYQGAIYGRSNQRGQAATGQNTNVPQQFGRSPYNFVPLPSKPKVFKTEEDFSVYKKNRLSGYLDYTLTNLTPLHTGDSFHQFTRIKNTPGLNGSTVRGLIRNLLESMAFANFKTFNNQRIYIRDERRNHEQTVKARRFMGWLRYDQNSREYRIWKVNRSDTQTPEGNIIKSTLEDQDPYGYYLVQIRGTQNNNGKEYEFDYPDFINGTSYPVNKTVIDNYNQDTDREVEGRPFNDLTGNAKRQYTPYGVPVFFSKTESGEILHFGHCINYRIPAGCVQDALPGEFLNPEGLDLAQHIFGDTATIRNEELIQAGKVSFEDAPLTGSDEITLHWKLLNILGAPKVKFYKNYLEQNGEQASVTWRSDNKKIRGYKFYQHKVKSDWEKLEISENEYQKLTEKNAALAKKLLDSPPPNGHRNARIKSLTVLNENDRNSIIKLINNDRNSQFKAVEVLDSTHTFSGRIRFDNLTETELGALLFILRFPENMALKIGMGKPLGLGSVKLKLDQLTLTDRKSRYKSLFTEDGYWHTGEITETGEIDQKATKAFKEYLLTGTSYSDIWQLPHMAELMAILEFDESLNSSKEWLEKTRYPLLKNPNLQGGNKNEFLRMNSLKTPRLFKS
ncbi:TIGR03986 family CRISPR-associated RAMP protein [Jiulongibacter sediminis]|uniref:TIGR03986 family type III CRISPR-associated RAMP protein n=1 Tax=Jiulongibacter sediminis TaxID=1605367 RepID=UPI0026F16778|nr:TIGR03986 family CRISPR-associated RAMP protein [Jiulongibacter sediminis]